jgi:hypothetical protein
MIAGKSVCIMAATGEVDRLPRFIEMLQYCRRVLPWADECVLAMPRWTFVPVEGLDMKVFPTDLTDRDSYGRFQVGESILSAFDTDFVLSVQLDGFPTRPDLWSDDFLQFDYIGAPWPAELNPYRVGNSGFSLRSRKWHEVSATLPYNNQGDDEFWCRDARDKCLPLDVGSHRWKSLRGFRMSTRSRSFRIGP